MRTVATCCALVLLLAGPPASPGAGEKESPPDALQATAKKFVAQLAAGDFAAAVKSFDATMKEALPAEKLREVWGALNAQAGPFKDQIGARAASEGKYRIVFVKCRFEKTVLEAKVVFNEAKEIAGLFFLPPGDAPAGGADAAPGYADPAAFRESAMRVGSGHWALPGTLALPAGGGPFPGLVLVHGSGPHDRDETIGPNRPFRDLAWGLASRGIGVLRYDKRTLVHAAGLMEARDRLTLEEETIADALTASRALRETAGIDGKRLYVLGHSLGGAALPRIASRDPRIAGLVMMAAPSRPLEDVLLDQMSYLFALDGAISGEETARLEEIKRQVARVKRADLAEAAEPGDLPLGLGRSYWLDLRRHGSPEAAASIRRPILVLQGGRDYQVTATDLDGWRRALSGRSDVEFRLYPGLNHLFMEGTGPGTPAEFDSPGHVAAAVIEDVAAWIKGSSRAGA
jgi:hypothetical protein